MTPNHGRLLPAYNSWNLLTSLGGTVLHLVHNSHLPFTLTLPLPHVFLPVIMTVRMLAFIRVPMTGVVSGLRVFSMAISPPKVRSLSTASLVSQSQCHTHTHHNTTQTTPTTPDPVKRIIVCCKLFHLWHYATTGSDTFFFFQR